MVTATKSGLGKGSEKGGGRGDKRERHRERKQFTARERAPSRRAIGCGKW